MPVARKKRVSDSDVRGFVLFPGVEVDQPHNLGVGKAELDKALALNLRQAGELGTAFYIFGCLDYTFPFEDQHHQSGFIFEIDRAANSILGIRRIDPRDGPIQPSDLVVRSNPLTPDIIN